MEFQNQAVAGTKRFFVRLCDFANFVRVSPVDGYVA
jgi:hypothetical protein